MYLPIQNVPINYNGDVNDDENLFSFEPDILK